MTETKRRVLVAAGVMLIRGGKILLGRRRSSPGAGAYGWCGGRAHAGERPIAAERRKAQEECGINVGAIALLSVGLFTMNGQDFVDFEFVAEEFAGEPELREPDRVEGWNWYSLDALPSPIFPPVQLGIDAYLSGRAMHRLEPTT